MSQARSEFSSPLGFILTATGSAVGLGNIWGFPTNAANNGGGAFLLVYLVLAFFLAYPALMAELVIGRYSRANIFTALSTLPSSNTGKKIGAISGIIGVLTASVILSFYALIAGWMLAHFCSYTSQLLGLTLLAQWFTEAGTARDISCALVFSVLTIMLVSEGIKQGLERWSTRLMPCLLLLFIILIVYVLRQKGAALGLAHYLTPDFSQIFQADLLLSALGQAFFSLSLGVGTMLIYGSYISRHHNLPLLGAAVTLIDVAIAFMAGLLILPAMFVAQQQGINIYENGQLVAGPHLIFHILPPLFSTFGAIGIPLGMVFFALMTIAALTSSISMLEVPTALLTEVTHQPRRRAAWLAGLLIFVLTLGIIYYFDPLFDGIITITTEFSEPLMGIVLCLFAGWVIHRNQLLKELQQGYPDIEKSLFWKIWPLYVRFVCPLLIAATFVQSLL